MVQVFTNLLSMRILRNQMSSQRNHRHRPKLNTLPHCTELRGGRGAGYRAFKRCDDVTEYSVANVRLDDVGSSKQLRYGTQNTEPVAQSWGVTIEGEGVGVLMVHD